MPPKAISTKPYAEVALFNSTKVTLIDADDLMFVSQWRWRLTEPRSGYLYAARSQKIGPEQWRVVFMHRTILNAPKGLVIDHLNHDGLDNRRSNLRLTNHSENRINSCKPPTSTTGFRGVSFHKHRGDYIAHIRKNGYLRHLGYFEEPVEAAKAYDRAARELHGKFAALNFPTSGKVRQMEFSFNPTSKKGRG